MLYSAVLVFSPFSVLAEQAPVEESESPAGLPPVLITEIQTGADVSGRAAEEFIELYNTTDEELDLAGWQLRYVSATASTVSIDKPSFRANIAPPEPDEDSVLLGPGEYYVLHTEEFEDAEGQIYKGNLTPSGSLVLFAPPDPLTCGRTAMDAVAWGDGDPVPTGGKDRVVSRLVDEEGNYVATNDNLHDFAAFDPEAEGSASPREANTHELPEEPAVSLEPEVTTGMVVDEESCSLPDPENPAPPSTPPPSESPPLVTEPPQTDPGEDPQPVIPAGNIGLKSPQISELLPNPAKPLTDADDEFIELYNPNDAPFDLSGYVLEVGLKTKRRYTIPAGTVIKPRTFLAFFSAETNLALSNSGSLAALVDPLGNLLVQSDAYSKAKDGQAWLLANGRWQWTTKPTPNALNVVSAPAVKKSGTSKSSKTTGKTASAFSSASASGSGGTDEDADDTVAFAATNQTPLHPGILAAVAVSALLYGAYEYRNDMANKLYQFRSNRAARRALRQSAKGR